MSPLKGVINRGYHAVDRPGPGPLSRNSGMNLVFAGTVREVWNARLRCGGAAAGSTFSWVVSLFQRD
jgi:hypothetical protein